MIRLLPLVVLLTACSEDSTELYFVKLRPDVADITGAALSITDLFGLELIATFDSATEGFSTRLPPLIVPTLQERPEIEYIEEDAPRKRKPKDPGGEVPGGDGVPDESEPPPDTVEIDEDEVTPTLSAIGGPYRGALSGVEVAVLDTGVFAHRDLNVVDYVDFVEQRTGRTRSEDDPDGHGTHVAGIIGAKADRAGMVGVAPGVPIHALRVLDDDGTGSSTDVLSALEYVLETPSIRVINLSLGGPRSTSGRDPVQGAIRRLEQAGVVVIVAAGNDTQDTENVWPAGYDLGMTISAVDNRGGGVSFADFSNYGTAVDLAAPGVGIQSTLPDDRYGKLSGTSMAAPHVAGAAAALLAMEPDLTPEQVRAALLEDATSTSGGNRHPEPLLQVPGR